jgi:hypothetical protein
LSTFVSIGPRRKNALGDDFKPEGPVQPRRGGFQETQM